MTTETTIETAKAKRAEAHAAAWVAEKAYARTATPETLAAKIEAWAAFNVRAREYSAAKEGAA